MENKKKYFNYQGRLVQIKTFSTFCFAMAIFSLLIIFFKTNVPLPVFVAPSLFACAGFLFVTTRMNSLNDSCVKFIRKNSTMTHSTIEYTEDTIASRFQQYGYEVTKTHSSIFLVGLNSLSKQDPSFIAIIKNMDELKDAITFFTSQINTKINGIPSLINPNFLVIFWGEPNPMQKQMCQNGFNLMPLRFKNNITSSILIAMAYNEETKTLYYANGLKNVNQGKKHALEKLCTIIESVFKI